MSRILLIPRIEIQRIEWERDLEVESKDKLE
jgi:hypothetical protein